MASRLQPQNSPRHTFQHLYFARSASLKAGQPSTNLDFQIHVATVLFHFEPSVACHQSRRSGMAPFSGCVLQAFAEFRALICSLSCCAPRLLRHTGNSGAKPARRANWVGPLPYVPAGSKFNWAMVRRSQALRLCAVSAGWEEISIATECGWIPGPSPRSRAACEARW